MKTVTSQWLTIQFTREKKALYVYVRYLVSLVAKRTKLKGAMRKSSINGNLNTFLSGIAPVKKLNTIKDVSSSQIDIYSLCCQENHDSFFMELDEVVHEFT